MVYKRLVTIFLALLLPWGGATAAADGDKILVLGDSLSAAFGIDETQGWVALLQQRLAGNGRDYQVVNASISGETSAGGLSRLPELLQRHRPEIVILALGANDGLRGLSLSQLRANLQRMIELARGQGSEVLLVGMLLPPNYGPAYTQRFHQVYTELAAQQQVSLVPFLLEGVAQDRRLFQSDGLHPTAAAQPTILDNVWARLKQLLDPTAATLSGASAYPATAHF